ncbi:hypothetical protein P7C70_g430, partial [Phenoliferia sp. Uapishka_3]
MLSLALVPCADTPREDIARACPTAGPAATGAVEGEASPAVAAAPRAPGFVGAPRGGLGPRIGGFAPGRGGFAGGRGAFVGGAPRVVRCYKCGELNHMARSCTAIVPGVVGVAAVVRPKTCYKVRRMAREPCPSADFAFFLLEQCQEEGHIARECPTNEAVTVA